jgi:hypothetical protein
MNSTKHHKKIHLSGNDDCCVVFCPECKVLELNLGATTLRINPESLHMLSSTLNHAKVRLAQIQNASPANDNARQASIRAVH